MKDRSDALHEKQRQAESEPNRRGAATARRWAIIMLLIILAVTALLRIRLLSVPLERDEGEYAYTGQLILQGVPPYEQAYTMKMPGVHAAYALIMATFGQTDKGIHAGLIVINTATIILLFLITLRLFGPLAAVVAAAAFAMLSLDRAVHGFIANAEHFVMLPALAGILLLLHAIDRPRAAILAAASFLLGTAFLMKQHAALFILFAGFLVLISELKRKPLSPKTITTRCAIFALAAALPFALTCLILYRAGAFDKFWFWTFTYARQYASALPLAAGWQAFKKISYIIDSSLLIWILSGTGVITLFADKNNRPQRLFTIAFVCFSFLSVCPGLYFRKHYFLLLTPAIALLTGLAAASLHSLHRRRLSAPAAKITTTLLLLLVFGHTIYTQRAYLFTVKPDTLARMTHGQNPFPESPKIARFIHQNTDPNDKIAVLGSEPQIPFYARRRSATRFLYMYPLMEPNPMASKLQKQIIAQIEAARPKIIVLVDIDLSWGAGPASDRPLPDWMIEYTDKYYDTAGIVDIVSPTYTAYVWQPQARTYKPESEHTILVFKRKNRT